MKIIKPQQLVFLKNAYKLGQNCYLGVSSIAGCYLSNTNHFVTESQIWEAWKGSPTSVPYLDIPIMKQFAEFVLIGHANIGQEVKSLDIEVRLDKIIKQWRIFGSGSYLNPNYFKKVSMDHINTWGGEGNLDNPLGTGYKNGTNHPTVVERHYDRLYERSALASPSPLPLDFKERKKYIDAVSSIMGSKKYLETIYPGYPIELDLRHFQISAPNQWSKDSVWKYDVDFNLIGFGGSKDPIYGKFANVNSRAFVWKDETSQIEEIPLLFQTIWFVPDYNLAFMVYTGAVKLNQHIFEEPYKYLMLALDDVLNPRPLSYFAKIYSKRINSDSALEYLLDYDLMTGAKSLDVITSKDNHPYSLKYENKPMDQSQVNQYFEDINKSILEHMPKDNKKIKQILQSDINHSKFVDILEDTSNLIIENKNFKAISNSLIKIEEKKFNNCAFYKINFNSLDFSNCVFNQCSFFECNFDKIRFIKSNLKNLEFYNNKFYNTDYVNSELTNCLYEKSVFENIILSNVKLLDSNFSFSFFKSCNFEVFKLENNIFSNVSLKNVNFKKGNLSIISFNKSDLNNIKFSELLLNNNSTIESNWDSCLFEGCQFNCFSAGTKASFNKLNVNDCFLEKVGLGNSIVTNSEFNYCSFKEINFGSSDLSYSKFNSCDMMVSIFKDAILYHNNWKNTSALQSIFYNSVLEGALFEHCNFAGSNFAMAFTDEDTTYIECLLDNIVWAPKRENKKA